MAWQDFDFLQEYRAAEWEKGNNFPLKCTQFEEEEKSDTSLWECMFEQGER